MPTLTAEEIAAVTKQKNAAASAQEAYTSQIAAQQAKADELAVVDGAFKKFFDYYNDDIIGRYDSERKELSGDYIASPVVEADIQACADLDTAGRLTPTMPATDAVRISQFDGTPTVNTTTNEQVHIANQALTEGYLVNGYDVTSYPGTLLTTTSLTAASTTLGLSDSATPMTMAIGKVFVVKSGSDLCVMRCTGINITPGGPPYVATANITFLVAPAGTITSGKTLDDFNGFTNTERTNKVTTDPLFQPFMNYLIAELQTYINARISRLNAQLTHLTANLDPDATAQIATATTNVNTSKTFLTNYLLTTVISNTGITSLSTERGVRSPQITTRLAQIIANYTGQTENYYDRRYQIANDRANTQRGTLRRHAQALLVKDTSQAFADSCGDQATALGNLLP